MTLLHIIHTESWDTRLFTCTVSRMLFYVFSLQWWMTDDQHCDTTLSVNAWNAQWISLRCESHIVNRTNCACLRVFVRGCSVFTARAYLCMCNSILHVCTRLTHYNGLNHWWLLTMDESSSEICTIHACAGKYDRTFLSGAVAFIAPFKLANLRSFINNLHSVWLSNVSFLTKIELKFRMGSHGCLFYQRI